MDMILSIFVCLFLFLICFAPTLAVLLVKEQEDQRAEFLKRLEDDDDTGPLIF